MIMYSYCKGWPPRNPLRIFSGMLDEDGLRLILLLEGRLHPTLEPVDLYKLAFQSVMGCDHLLEPGREERSRFMLRREWESLPPFRGAEPPLQILDPARGTARLHLRPLKAMGFGLEPVMEAIISQEPMNGDPAEVAGVWAGILGLSRRGLLPFDRESLESFVTPLSVPHHSRAYGPVSYRVVNDVGRFVLDGLQTVPEGSVATGPPSP